MQKSLSFGNVWDIKRCGSIPHTAYTPRSSKNLHCSVLIPSETEEVLQQRICTQQLNKSTIMGRSNLNRRGRGGGRGRGKSSYNSSNKRDVESKKKTLQDYIYHSGTTKQASEYTKITNYLINHIRRNFKRPGNIANALEKLEEYDPTTTKPMLQLSGRQNPDLAERERTQYFKRNMK